MFLCPTIRGGHGPGSYHIITVCGWGAGGQAGLEVLFPSPAYIIIGPKKSAQPNPIGLNHNPKSYKSWPGLAGPCPHPHLLPEE